MSVLNRGTQTLGREISTHHGYLLFCWITAYVGIKGDNNKYTCIKGSNH